jgi:hypothetical protein
MMAKKVYEQCRKSLQTERGLAELKPKTIVFYSGPPNMPEVKPINFIFYFSKRD